MAFGKLKCDTILYTNNQGAETPVTVEDLATAANGINTNTGNITTNATNIATNTTDIATNTTNIASNVTALAAKAPLASPQFTGIPVARGDGSSTDGQIQLNCAQNSHGVKIKSPPHSAGASYTLTLPADAGLTGYALTTDGTGVLSWVDYVPKVGNTTLTGDLTVTGDLLGTGDITRTGDIALTGGVTVTTAVTLPVTDPTNNQHAASKGYVDAQVGSKASLGVALALG